MGSFRESISSIEQARLNKQWKIRQEKALMKLGSHSKTDLKRGDKVQVLDLISNKWSIKGVIFEEMKGI